MDLLYITAARGTLSFKQTNKEGMNTDLQHLWCDNCRFCLHNNSIGSLQTRELDVIWNNAFPYIYNCCWRESVKPIQFYCNTMPLSYMSNEHKLLFYRKISASKNVILRTLMCLPAVSSDHMFLCSKYGVRPTSTRDSIRVAVAHVFMASLDAYLWAFLLCTFLVCLVWLYFYVLPSSGIINK